MVHMCRSDKGTFVPPVQICRSDTVKMYRGKKLYNFFIKKIKNKFGVVLDQSKAPL
jgi:hypothetical protein